MVVRPKEGTLIDPDGPCSPLQALIGGALDNHRMEGGARHVWVVL